jgi:hypothetical protein
MISTESFCIGQSSSGLLPSVVARRFTEKMQWDQGPFQCRIEMMCRVSEAAVDGDNVDEIGSDHSD